MKTGESKYAKKLARRRSMGLPEGPSLSVDAAQKGIRIPFPLPLTEGYTRPYYAGSKGSRELTPLPCEDLKLTAKLLRYK